MQDIKRLHAEANRLAGRSTQMLRVLLRTVTDPIERSQLHAEAVALRGARRASPPPLACRRVRARSDDATRLASLRCQRCARAFG